MAKDNLPSRKRNRLEKDYYSLPGSVFITICTHQRKNLLSNIVGAIHESPAIQLTQYGSIVDCTIKDLPRRFPVSIDQYVIMPNHIHIIVTVKACDEVRAIRESPLPKRSIISNVIGYLKMNSSKEIHRMIEQGTIWQRSFYDHVIRNGREYEEIAMYMAQNPQTWREDCLWGEGANFPDIPRGGLPF